MKDSAQRLLCTLLFFQSRVVLKNTFASNGYIYSSLI